MQQKLLVTMNIIETVRAARVILDRPTQRTLLFATVATILISLLDTIAISLILPLVNLASGSEATSVAGAFVRDLLNDPDPRTLLVIMTTAVVVLFILKDLGALAFSWWLGGFKAIKRVELSTRLLHHYLRAPYTEISRRSSAELLRTMNDAVLQFFGTTVFALMTLLSNVSTLVAISIALLVSAPIPSLALGAYFGLAMLFYLKVMKPRSTRAGRTAAEASSAAYRTAFAALGGIKETKLRGSEDFFVDRYRQAAMRGARASRLAGFISGAPRYFLEILFIVAVGVLLLGGLTLFGAPSAEGGLGLLALFVAAGLRALPAVTSLGAQISNLHFGAGFVGVVLEEVRAEQNRGEAAHPTEVLAPVQFQRELVLRDVSFAYPRSTHPALHNINLTVRHGGSVAIVGESGSGKSTLIDIILGLHQPSQGQLTVDGVDMASCLGAWQRGIGYVPQDIYLREATLAENVAFDEAADEIDAFRLGEAIRHAQLTNVVAELAEGYDTPIGERGSRLSGGQRQRIGIARALYRQPQLLVLDEATSALDNETEHRVSESIRNLHGKITTIVVAHRLSTVRHVDTIVVLHEGRIDGAGSFEEMRASNERFARMVSIGSLE